MRMNMSQGEELENPVTPPRIEVIRQLKEQENVENSKWNNLIEKEDVTSFYHLNECKESDGIKYITTEPECPIKRKRYNNKFERKQFKYNKYNRYNKNNENLIDEEENKIQNDNFRSNSNKIQHIEANLSRSSYKPYNSSQPKYIKQYPNENKQMNKNNVSVNTNTKKSTSNANEDSELTNALLQLVNNRSFDSSIQHFGNNNQFVIDDNLIAESDNNKVETTKTNVINPNSKWNSFI